MKRLSRMFVLTPHEQRLVVFAMSTLVIGVLIKHYLEAKTEERAWPIESEQAKVTVTPIPKN